MLLIYLTGNHYFIIFLRNNPPQRNLNVKLDSNKIVVRIEQKFTENHWEHVLPRFSEEKSTVNKFSIFTFEFQKILIISGNENGISFNTTGERSRYSRLFIPKDAFDEFYLAEDQDYSDIIPNFAINYSLLIDFLNLSLIRGPTTVIMTAWKGLDHINLK